MRIQQTSATRRDQRLDTAGLVQQDSTHASNLPQRGRRVSDAVASQSEGTIAPIFISVKQAAKALNVSDWVAYKLCDSGALESRYIGRRRLVLVESLHAYARSLPTVPEAS